MTQAGLFGSLEPDARKPTRVQQDLEVLITVKAAPTPSEKSGETVCVAGLALSANRLSSRFVRLYPVNYRNLEQDVQFKKYDIVKVSARPSSGDTRVESWNPIMTTLKVIEHLPPWKRRRALLDPVLEDSMCRLNRENQAGATGRSLALVRAKQVRDLQVSLHPGWTEQEQSKIDKYINQLDLFNERDKTPLEAPRMIGHFRWLCYETACQGHRQSIIDWEFVALQRRLSDASDEQLVRALRERFLEEICHSGREIAFFVGNQAKRHHVFHVLGIYYPS